jgi:hypothetical protein
LNCSSLERREFFCDDFKREALHSLRTQR